MTHVPGGQIADRYGGKHTLGLGILATVLCTFATPWAAKVADVGGAVGVRILMGLGEVRHLASAQQQVHIHVFGPRSKGVSLCSHRAE